MKVARFILLFVCLPVLVWSAETPRTLPSGLPQPDLPAGLGVNIHFVEPPARDVEMIAAAGFEFVRMDFIWDRVEHAEGKYDFAGYDKLVEALSARGIRILFILDYGNKLYGNEFAVATGEQRQAFARFAGAAAAHFKGRGVLWELWNEPNISGFWRPQPNVDDYMALAKAALPAVRRADPEATIIAPAASTIDMKFLEACFQRGLLELVDGVSVHPYRGGPPETVTGEYERLRALISRYAPKDKPNIPILSGEWGYTVTAMPPEKQGQYLPRQFLVNLMNGVPLSIWYDWHDDGQDPKDGEQNFGTVTWDYKPKPTYHAAQTLIKELRGYRYTRRLALPSADDYAVVFTNGPRQKLVFWTTGVPHRVSLEFNGARALDLTGDPQYLAQQ